MFRFSVTTAIEAVASSVIWAVIRVADRGEISVCSVHLDGSWRLENVIRSVPKASSRPSSVVRSVITIVKRATVRIQVITVRDKGIKMKQNDSQKFSKLLRWHLSIAVNEFEANQKPCGYLNSMWYWVWPYMLTNLLNCLHSVIKDTAQSNHSTMKCFTMIHD